MQNRPMVRWLAAFIVLFMARPGICQSWYRGSAPTAAADPAAIPRQLAPTHPSWQPMAGAQALQGGVPTPAVPGETPAAYLGVSPAAGGPPTAGGELARRLQQARQTLRGASAGAPAAAQTEQSGVSHRRRPDGIQVQLPPPNAPSGSGHLRSVLNANSAAGAAAGDAASPWQDAASQALEPVPSDEASSGVTAQLGDLPPGDLSESAFGTPVPTGQEVLDTQEPGRISFSTSSADSGVESLAPIANGPSNMEAGGPQSGGGAAEVPGESAGSLLLSHQSPRLSVHTVGPKTIVIGRTATYEVAIANEGDTAAKDVQVQVVIPEWAEIASAQSAAGSAQSESDQQGHTVLRWSLPRVEGRASEKLSLEIIPRSSRPFDLQVTWTFTPATSLAHIQVQEPKLAMTLVGPQDVLYGETKVYTIELSNPGTGDAENVVLRLLPLQPGDPPPGERPMGVLEAGARKSIEVELTARQAGQLQVRAAASAAGGLQCEASQDVLVRRANVDVQIQGPEMEYAGTSATYVIRVSNIGDAPAADVVTSVILPDGAQYESATDGAAVNAEHRQVGWKVGMLAPGAVRVLELTCVLTAPGDNRLDVRTRGEPELVSVQSISTRVEALADLQLVVNDPRGAVPVGTETSYEIRIVNRGTKAAEDIQVLGYFSDGIEPTAVSGWQGMLAEGQVQLDTIPRLGPGQEMTVKISAQAVRAGSHVFQAELDCSNPETHLVHQESTRFYGDSPVASQGTSTPRTAAAPATPPRRLDLRR